jgi:nitrogen fixation/metabolism regulation signal transduction histidine kinase
MNQVLTIVVGAIVIGIIAVVILAGYTSASASKLPEQGEMVQVFGSGSIVGAFIVWLLSSGYLHGGEVFSMFTSDVKHVVKEIALKGGEEMAAASAAAAAVSSTVAPVLNNTPSEPQAMAQMVGGFLKSMGFETPSLKELTVGMPTF